MGKYFGTDGVRGRANEGLTLDMSIKIGQYLGWYYGKEKHAKILNLTCTVNQRLHNSN